MKKTMNPHDKFFREIIENIETAKDFIKNYLPNDIVDLFEIDKLEATKDSYVEETLKEYFSDVLFKTTYKGELSYIYILIEHKSYPYKFVAFQQLKYMLLIWEKLLQSKEKTKPNKEKKESFKLPVILPIVFYHGKEKWDIGLRFSDIVDIKDDNLRKHCVEFEYILEDFSEESTIEIKGQEILKAAITLMKYIFEKDKNKFKDKFEDGLRYLKNLDKDTQRSVLLAMVYYVYSTKDINVNLIKKSVKEVLDEGSEFDMTIAAAIRREGIKEGEKRGEKRGEIKGLLEGIILALEVKFKEIPLSVNNKLNKIKSIENLESLKEVIKKADKLEDVEEVLKGIK